LPSTNALREKSKPCAGYYISFVFQSPISKGSCEIGTQTSPTRISARDGINRCSPLCRGLLLVWVLLLFVHFRQKLNALRWTSSPSISLWAPLMAGYLLGFAINWIFVRAAFSVSRFVLIS
jgi:hypothetical protein